MTDAESFEVTVVWHGKPATKKNSSQIFWRKDRGLRPKKPSRCWPYSPFIFPSQSYRTALKSALQEIRAQRVKPAPPRTPLLVEAHFYLGARQSPDLDGLINACGDILESAGVIANDYWIAGWDGSRRHRDLKDPRTEVVIRLAESHVLG